MGKLLLLFTLVPIVELYVLFQIGHAFGGLLPVLFVVGSALIGTSLARLQGLRMFEAWRTSLARGVLPSQSVVDGVLVLLACLLLIVPGVITDGLALLLLIPPLRRPFGGWLMHRVARAIQRGTVHVAQQPAAPRRSRAGAQDVIDVEAEEVLPAEPPKQLKAE